MKISRREFIRLTAGAGALGLVGPAEAYCDVLPAVVDSSVATTADVARLKEKGVKVVIRYYALREQWAGKRVQKEEADRILDAGLSLGISYQYKNGDIDTFTAARAKLDVDQCLMMADKIDQPRGSAIYFGVDNGWDDEASIGKVTEYFRTINELKGDRFEVGVYGSGLMCTRLKNHAKFFWIAGLSDSWPGKLEFVRNGTWNLYQNALEVAVGSIRVDTDVVNPKAASIGSFSRPTPGGANVLDGGIDNQSVLATQRFIKGNGHALFDMPDGTVLQKLAAGKMVTTIEEAGSFTLVDVPRQIKFGRIQIADFVRGYCKSEVLVPIDQDPS